MAAFRTKTPIWFREKPSEKIMGGLGSGRRASLGLMVDKTNEFHSIDLAWLRRQKLLKPGHRSSLSWSSGGRQTGSIRFEYLGHCVRLVYRQRSRGGEWQDVNEIVWLIDPRGWTPDDIFVDVDHLSAGAAWEQKLLAEAKAAQAVLFIASQASVNPASFCSRDLQASLGHIIAFTIGGLAALDLEDVLAGIASLFIQWRFA